jgi:hypothetical protein
MATALQQEWTRRPVEILFIEDGAETTGFGLKGPF